jgi:hypothetical protein
MPQTNLKDLTNVINAINNASALGIAFLALLLAIFSMLAIILIA